MTSITKEVLVQAPLESVWGVLADLGRVENFHPLVQKSYYTSGTREGSGAARACEFYGGLKLEETVVRWVPLNSMTLRIHFAEGQKPPIRDTHATLSLSREGAGTRVVMHVRYEPRFKPLGLLADALLIAPQYHRLVPQVLSGLKQHVETGERIDHPSVKRATQPAAL